MGTTSTTPKAPTREQVFALASLAGYDQNSIFVTDTETWLRIYDLADGLGWLTTENVEHFPNHDEGPFEVYRVSGVRLYSPPGCTPATDAFARSDYLEGHRIITGNDPGDENDAQRRTAPILKLVKPSGAPVFDHDPAAA